MVTRLVSFGFKYGTPVDADLVLDVRFLDNPYFVPELKPLTGLDDAVVRHVMSAPETQEFMRRTRDLLSYVLPRYEREGKSYLTIAVGCTGGRHRSVTIADALARDLAGLGLGASGTQIAVVHRDVNRGGIAAPSERVERRDRAERASSPDDTGDRSSVLELKGVTTAPPSHELRAGAEPQAASGKGRGGAS
jgi:UPF0042 nucleotide-binding protein